MTTTNEAVLYVNETCIGTVAAGDWAAALTEIVRFAADNAAKFYADEIQAPEHRGYRADAALALFAREYGLASFPAITAENSRLGTIGRGEYERPMMKITIGKRCPNCDEQITDRYFSWDYCGSHCAFEFEANHPRARKFEVCDRCEGRGTHVSPLVDGNGLTAADLDELGPDFIDDYKAGVYDVACYDCGGARVTSKADLQKAHERAIDAAIYRAESGIW